MVCNNLLNSHLFTNYSQHCLIMHNFYILTKTKWLLLPWELVKDRGQRSGLIFSTKCKKSNQNSKTILLHIYIYIYGKNARIYIWEKNRCILLIQEATIGKWTNTQAMRKFGVNLNELQQSVKLWFSY